MATAATGLSLLATGILKRLVKRTVWRLLLPTFNATLWRAVNAGLHLLNQPGRDRMSSLQQYSDLFGQGRLQRVGPCDLLPAELDPFPRVKFTRALLAKKFSSGRNP